MNAKYFWNTIDCPALHSMGAGLLWTAVLRMFSDMRYLFLIYAQHDFLLRTRALSIITYSPRGSRDLFADVMAPTQTPRHRILFPPLNAKDDRIYYYPSDCRMSCLKILGPPCQKETLDLQQPLTPRVLLARSNLSPRPNSVRTSIFNAYY